MSDEKAPRLLPNVIGPPPMWRLYRCDDGVWQCHPSQVAGWPEDVSTLCGKSAFTLVDRAWAAMEKVVAPYVAAELRRMAEYGEDGPGGRPPQVVTDNSEGTHGEDTHTTYANKLRDRADQLDPPACAAGSEKAR